MAGKVWSIAYACLMPFYVKLCLYCADPKHKISADEIGTVCRPELVRARGLYLPFSLRLRAVRFESVLFLEASL